MFDKNAVTVFGKTAVGSLTTQNLYSSVEFEKNTKTFTKFSAEFKLIRLY